MCRSRAERAKKRDGGRLSVILKQYDIHMFNNHFTRVVFIPGLSLDLLLGVLTASEQLPRRFVNRRAVLAPTASGLRPHLKPVVRPGPKRGEHHVPLRSEFVTDVRFVTPRIELDL